MKKLIFSNKDTTINATIENGSIVFENGKEYHINARYGGGGITGAYITDGGLTYSLKDFSSVADEITALIIAQPKKERKQSDGGAVKSKNLVKLASASDERIALILCDGLFKACEKCKEYGATVEAIERAQGIAIGALLDGDKYASIAAQVESEIAREREAEERERAERERKAVESAQARVIAGIMTMYKVNRATAEAMAQALANVNIEQPQA